MIEGIIGFCLGIIFALYVILPRGLRSFIVDHTDVLFVEKINDVHYYIQISDKMPPSKER